MYRMYRTIWQVLASEELGPPALSGMAGYEKPEIQSLL